MIATTNRDLGSEVRAGRFREDLLFRLNVVNLHMPALRDRTGGHRAAQRTISPKYATANGLPGRPSERGRAAAAPPPLAGNVRELENCIHRAVLLAAGDEIGPDAIALQGASRRPQLWPPRRRRHGRTGRAHGR